MRSGTIELESGRWHWTLLPQWTGATVVFQHRERVHDEMRSWTQENDLSPEEVRELALDPLERTWMDMDGLKWRISIELPSGWRRLEGAEAMKVGLVFRRGAVRKVVAIAESAKLGGFSHSQLRDLLEEAYTSEADFG